MEEECLALLSTIFSEYWPKHTEALVVRLSRMPSSFLGPLIISRDAYLRYAFSRYTYLRYAFSRYAFLSYAYLRYACFHRSNFSNLSNWKEEAW